MEHAGFNNEDPDDLPEGLWDFFAFGLGEKEGESCDTWKSNSVDGNIVFVPSQEYNAIYSCEGGYIIECDLNSDREKSTPGFAGEDDAGDTSPTEEVSPGTGPGEAATEGPLGPLLMPVVRDISEQFRLLDDPTRLRILNVLVDGESNIGDLYRQGYELLRAAPDFSTPGLVWGCSIVPAADTRLDHGAQTSDDVSIFARYESGHGVKFFGWDEAENDAPSDLATKFIKRFPDLAARGKGAEPDYALWCARMLRATALDGLIYARVAWDLPADRLPTLGCGAEVKIPIPTQAKLRPKTKG